jgi:Flp pilus assembly protein TadG
MIGKFLKDRRGNFALMTAIAMVPLMGALALAIDYAEVTRQKQATLNALDAAGIATARYLLTGADDDETRAYAKAFFEVNLGSIDPDDTALDVTLPTSTLGGGTLKLAAKLTYRPYFLPAFKSLMGASGSTELSVNAKSEIRLKNTLEVALVLDNSGSMNETGSGSGEKRIDLLKAAAKQLVDTLALQANLIKQVEKPVQFALVPFAASVNVGPENAGAAWMDVNGKSPIHHENFDWSTLSAPDKYAEQAGGIWYKKGIAWGAEEGQVLSRFSLYRDMRVVTSHERVDGSKRYVCTKYYNNGTCDDGYYAYDYVDTYGPFASWQGCVEVRPHPLNINDDPGVSSDPSTLFVPMFAPDEPGNHWRVTQDPDETPKTYGAANSWWNDDPSSTTGTTRQRNMAKYFMARAADAPVLTKGRGPNYSCTTKAITPLTDVSTEEGLTAVKAAIDEMVPNGNTNVPEGTAWGWRTVSHGEPFPEGRLETEKGNDKVVIVLTDGANTYGDLGSTDPAGNKSTYAAYGYTGQAYGTTAETRLFKGTSSAIGRSNYTAGNYTSALNEQMAALCANAKASKVLVMTVSLDLDTADYDENQAIEALKKCSSDSRFRKDSADPSKPAKLFWNATGSNLAEKFREIADELSNLRIVG